METIVDHVLGFIIIAGVTIIAIFIIAYVFIGLGWILEQIRCNRGLNIGSDGDDLKEERKKNGKIDFERSCGKGTKKIGAKIKSKDEDFSWIYLIMIIDFILALASVSVWFYGERTLKSFKNILNTSLNAHILYLLASVMVFLFWVRIVIAIKRVIEKKSYNNGWLCGIKKGLVEGRNKGYTEGFSRGRSIGDKAGFDVGCEKGFSEGKIVGDKEGFSRGKSEGIEQEKQIGLSEGRKEGYEIGFEGGCKEGFSKGKVVGQKEGFIQGEIQGIEKGKQEGLVAGRAEGNKIGYERGLQEGGLKGYRLGHKEGRQKGLDMGQEKSEREGYERGLVVGRLEGDKIGYKRGLQEGRREVEEEIRKKNKAAFGRKNDRNK